MTPGGCARMPARGFEPPRLGVPPRPWKSVSSTPALRAASERSDSARKSAQREAASPDSLLESE